MKTVKIAFKDFWENFEDDVNCDLKNMVENVLSEKYNVEISDNPDYLFYSCFGLEHYNKKYDDCVKIFFTGEMITPDFNECDYAMGFDYLSFGDRYLRFPLYRTSKMLEKATQKHSITESDIAKKTKFCSFIVSNENGQPIRREIFEKLCEYKKVDSGGRFLNNIGGSVADKYEFNLSYKFSLCFENCVAVGYTTEKLIDAFATKTIPVYYGDPKVCDEFNPDSFINCAECKTVEEMIDRIKKVDLDDELYIKMLKAPIFSNHEEFAQNEDFRSFILNIFEQPLFSAYRIPHSQKIKNVVSDRKKLSEYYYSPIKERLRKDIREFFKGKK